PEVDQVPVFGHALARAILAHRRHHHAIPQLDPADPERAEKVDLRHFAVVNGVRRATVYGAAARRAAFNLCSTHVLVLSWPVKVSPSLLAGTLWSTPARNARVSRRAIESRSISCAGFDLPIVGASSYAERVRQPIRRR